VGVGGIYRRRVRQRPGHGIDVSCRRPAGADRCSGNGGRVQHDAKQWKISNAQGDRTVGITDKPTPEFLDRLKGIFGFEPSRDSSSHLPQ
jgi:hypothetical protein